MSTSKRDSDQLSPEKSWRTIHDTMDQSRNSMYLAGTDTILLLWGGLMALGYLGQFAILSLANDFAERSPWIFAPFWLVVVAIGMIASSIIGYRASKSRSDGNAARNAGLRVFAFWIVVAAAAFLIPGVAGLWNDETSSSIPGVAISIIALGYTLFGIMHRPALAVVGVGIAAAYFIPDFLLGDAAAAVTAVLMLAVVFAGAIWLRKSGVA